MNKVIPFQQSQVVFGMGWFAVKTDTAGKRKMDHDLKEMNAQYYLTLSAEHATVCGAIDELEDDDIKIKKKSLVSAAALFASHPELSGNRILTITLNDRLVALIAVIEELPYIDMVLTQKTLEHKIDSVLDETCQGFDFYGDHAYKGTSPLAFSLEQLVYPQNRSTSLLPYADKTFLWILLIAILILGIIVSGIYWWKTNSDQISIDQNNLSISNPIDVYTKNVKIELGRLPPSASQLIHSDMLTTLKNRPVFDAGWTLKNIDCDDKGHCEEKWEMAYGTFNDFLTAHPNDKVNFIKETNTISYRYEKNPIWQNPQSKTPTIAQPIATQDLPTQSDLTQHQGSLEQSSILAGIHLKSEIPKIFATPPKINAKNIPVNIQILEGKWSAVGSLIQLEELLAQLPNHFRYRELHVQLRETDTTFMIGGTYYVKP